jgi:predicted nucleic acid-binding protein
MSTREAAAVTRSWLRQPCAQFLGTHAEQFEETIRLIERSEATGNLVTDVQIAALAIKHDAILHTTDMDFLRFPGLRWLNPLSGSSKPTRNS